MNSRSRLIAGSLRLSIALVCSRYAAIAFLLLLSIELATFSHAQALPHTIAITAVDPDGTNTGTARLGVTLNLTATVSPGALNYTSWTLEGPGTFHSGGGNDVNGVYNPPESMPANST